MSRDVDAGKFSMDRSVLQTEEIPAEVRAVVAADCDVLEAHFSLEYERKFMNPILSFIISMLRPLRSGAS